MEKSYRVVGNIGRWAVSEEALVRQTWPPTPSATHVRLGQLGVGDSDPHLIRCGNGVALAQVQEITPRGTPPKEAAAHRATHKKMQIRALLSRTAKDLSPVALVLWNWLMARTS